MGCQRCHWSGLIKTEERCECVGGKDIEEPYCDVCGCSGKDLRSPVEICRDCYDGAGYVHPAAENLLTKAVAFEEALRPGGDFTKDFLEGDSLCQAAIAYGKAMRADQRPRPRQVDPNEVIRKIIDHDHGVCDELHCVHCAKLRPQFDHPWREEGD